MVAGDSFVQSFIDPPTWDAAGWYGVGFLTPKSDLPAMILMFGDGNAARRIFEGWRKRLGERDVYEELRVAVIEGDIPGLVPGYSVHITTNFEGVERRAKAEGQEITADEFFTFSKVRRMVSPQPSPLLAKFKASYAGFKSYRLMGAIGGGPADNGVPTFLRDDLTIIKQWVAFRRAEDIGPTDLDVVALSLT